MSSFQELTDASFRLTIGFIVWTVVPDSFMHLLVYSFLQQVFLEYLLCSGHSAKTGTHCWAGQVLFPWVVPMVCWGIMLMRESSRNEQITAVAGTSGGAVKVLMGASASCLCVGAGRGGLSRRASWRRRHWGWDPNCISSKFLGYQ